MVVKLEQNLRTSIYKIKKKNKQKLFLNHFQVRIRRNFVTEGGNPFIDWERWKQQLWPSLSRLVCVMTIE